MSNKLKTKFKTAGTIINNSVAGTVITAFGFSVLGICAHFSEYMLYKPHDNYSIKHRFETAYSFDTPENHKLYDVTVSEYDENDEKIGTFEESHTYSANPYVTYSIIVLGGIAAGIISGLDANKKRTIRNLIKPRNQNTR